MEKMKTCEEFLNETAYQFFTNEDVNKFAFHALPKAEKHQVAAHASLIGLSEFVNNPLTVKDAVKVADNHDTANGEKYQASTSLSAGYFSKIVSSNGDVRKTANYVSNRSLIAYAKSVCGSNGAGNTGHFMKKLTELELALNNLEKYAPEFAKVMDYEARTYKEESKRVMTQFYTNVVVAVDVGVDVLYSYSINADIDYSRRPAFVKTVHFECPAEFMAEHFTLIHYFNSLAISGKLRNVLDKGTLDSLLTARDKVLREENVLDAVFAMVASNKYTDLLLLPLYVIRMVVYTVKYLSASYQKLTFSIGQSIAMVRKTTVTEDEFKSYKKEANFKAAQFDQASKKAAMDTSATVKADTEGVVDLAKQRSDGVSNSTLI